MANVLPHSYEFHGLVRPLKPPSGLPPSQEKSGKPSSHRSVQYRVVGGALYRRDTDPYAYDIRVHELGHGHTEATVLPRYGWSEVDNLSQFALASHAASEGHIWSGGGWVPYVPTAEEKLKKLTCNIERSTRRARTKVRRLCKAKGLSTMLTLTYQENMIDRDRMVRDFDVFIKRVRRVIPDLQYVCVFERQKRGAWHAHIAVPRVLSHYHHSGALVRSYDLLRSMWRGVIGAGGNVDVSRNKRVSRSTAKLAGYLAKYIGKDMGSDSEGDSYRASGRALPAAVVFRSHPVLLDAFCECLDLISSDMTPTSRMHEAWLSTGGAFISISPS